MGDFVGIRGMCRWCVEFWGNDPWGGAGELPESWWEF